MPHFHFYIAVFRRLSARRLLIGFVLPVVLGLAACGGGGGMSEAPAEAPSITAQPAPQAVLVGQTATFTVTATGSAPLAYQWQRNGVAIGGATTSTYTTPAAALTDNGAAFVVVVSNAAGATTSSSAVLSVTVTAPAAVATDVFTSKNDQARSGQNLTESILTPANVNATTFGLLRVLAVDGKVDAQPLYLSKLTLGASSHNVVFIATEHDSVYAMDADTGATLWHVSLLLSGEVPRAIRATAARCLPRLESLRHPSLIVQLRPMASSTSSPCLRTPLRIYHQRLHALDITSGAELFGGPKEITATYASAGGATQVSISGQYEERAALLLTERRDLYQLDLALRLRLRTAAGSSPTMIRRLRRAFSTSRPTAAAAAPAIWMAGGGPAGGFGRQCLSADREWRI